MAEKQKAITASDLASLVSVARNSGRKDLQDLFKAVAIADGKGARSTSSKGSWTLEVNGMMLASARNRTRRFGSLDSLHQTLCEIGIPHFIVVNAACPAGHSVGAH